MFAQNPTPEQRRRALELVMEIGAALMENGAEVFRVQQTMYIIAHALHLREFTVYVIANGIFATAGTNELSALRHIPICGMHLGRVTELNALSRDMAEGRVENITQAEMRVAFIRAMPPSPPWAQVAASGAGAAFFAMMFGGTLADGLAAAACGSALGCFQGWSERHSMAPIFARLLGSALVYLLGQSIAAACAAVQPDAAIIGALLVLTPGVAFTSAVRDLLHGDYLSGSIRLTDAFLSAGAMACGVFVSYKLIEWRRALL